MNARWHPLLAVAATLAPVTGWAQARPSVGLELTTGERRRGLSWSEGQASASADAAIAIAGLEASARVAALRGSPRHAGADGGADLTVATGFGVGAVQLRANATGHLFAGARERMDYWEVGGDASYTIGPLRLEVGARVAPAQRAIGGTNLYLFAGAAAGIPATPLTLSAAIGRTLGDDDRRWSDRLRPGGDYTDWRIGAEHAAGPLTLRVDYVGTDLAGGPVAPIGDLGNSGDRVVGSVRLSF